MKFQKNKIGNISRAGALLAGLCIMAFLIVSLMPVLAQSSDSDPARSYCVKMGYLYKTSPGTNGGQGICEFPDKAWCDAQAYYSGTCNRVLSPHIYPAYVYGSDGRYVAPAAQLCLGRGGNLQSVHTPYGDVTMCVFPDGGTCDLQSLARGTCGTDYWSVYARSWLDAP